MLAHPHHSCLKPPMAVEVGPPYQTAFLALALPTWPLTLPTPTFCTPLQEMATNPCIILTPRGYLSLPMAVPRGRPPGLALFKPTFNCLPAFLFTQHRQTSSSLAGQPVFNGLPTVGLRLPPYLTEPPAIWCLCPATPTSCLRAATTNGRAPLACFYALSTTVPAGPPLPVDCPRMRFDTPSTYRPPTLIWFTPWPSEAAIV